MQEEQDSAREPLYASMAKMRHIRPDLDIALRDPATGEIQYAGAYTPDVAQAMQGALSQMLSPKLEAELHAKLPELNPARQLNGLLRSMLEPDEALDRFLYKCYSLEMRHKQIIELLKVVNAEWYKKLRKITRVAVRKRADKYQERRSLPLLPKQNRMK